ncbi:hypothetical protein EJ08DRAFT_653411 [Tothia fuscella]|uniref:Tautomerase cis-CaaD-like domain-containing protein n=1 Tax=Tothia fuscella TaxID=1048955 RepID=A0A9P4NHA3_9PEZI|nr:hypothetical protein EJ08DRAFT_653411 [Tothia fuscella]
MPLWSIFHSKDAFTNQEAKRAFSEDITKMYTENLGLPAFYVVVHFFHMPECDVWVGGGIKLDKPFVRVVIEHTAVNAPRDQGDEAYRTTCNWVDKAMKPHVTDKGYDSEYHISENDRRLWKMNGMIPPPWKSYAEKEWFNANKALPWLGDH